MVNSSPRPTMAQIMAQKGITSGAPNPFGWRRNRSLHVIHFHLLGLELMPYLTWDFRMIVIFFRWKHEFPESGAITGFAHVPRRASLHQTPL